MRTLLTLPRFWPAISSRERPRFDPTCGVMELKTGASVVGAGLGVGEGVGDGVSVGVGEGVGLGVGVTVCVGVGEGTGFFFFLRPKACAESALEKTRRTVTSRIQL